MADYLDDFFAKKDKKRGKNKGTGVLSSEALVRELEEGSKQVEYSARKENKTSAAIEILGLDADDADWRDFDDVDKRDYSGLKVKEMSLQDQSDAEQRRPSSEQVDPDTIAWKIKDETASASTESSQSKPSDSSKSDIDSTMPSKTVELPTEQSNKNPEENQDNTGDKQQSAKYVPPHARNQGSDIKVLEPIRLAKTKTSLGRGNLPDIQDESAFPSLG